MQGSGWRELSSLSCTPLCINEERLRAECRTTYNAEGSTTSFKAAAARIVTGCAGGCRAASRCAGGGESRNKSQKGGKERPN